MSHPIHKLPFRVPKAWRMWSLGSKELPAWVQSSSGGVWSSLPCNQAFQTCLFSDSISQAFLGGSCRWIFWVTVRWNFKVDFLGPPENVPKTFSFHHRTVHRRMLCNLYVLFQIAGKDDNINAPVLLGDRTKLRSIKFSTRMASSGWTLSEEQMVLGQFRWSRCGGITKRMRSRFSGCKPSHRCAGPHMFIPE